jgi:hypothetical protein
MTGVVVLDEVVGALDVGLVVVMIGIGLVTPIGSGLTMLGS